MSHCILDSLEKQIVCTLSTYIVAAAAAATDSRLAACSAPDIRKVTHDLGRVIGNPIADYAVVQKRVNVDWLAYYLLFPKTGDDSIRSPYHNYTFRRIRLSLS